MEFLDDLESYCEFGPERVYVLMAIARRKDQTGDYEDGPVIRKVVEDRDGLARAVAELDHATRRFDARYRLYVSANARDVTRAFFALRSNMDDWLRMRLGGNEDVLGKFRRVDSEFKSVLQSDTCKDETNFIFDLDDATSEAADRLRERLAERTTVSMVRATPNGYHVVTDPFDYTTLATDVEYELKTDGMIFLSFVGE